MNNKSIILCILAFLLINNVNKAQNIDKDFFYGKTYKSVTKIEKDPERKNKLIENEFTFSETYEENIYSPSPMAPSLSGFSFHINNGYLIITGLQPYYDYLTFEILDNGETLVSTENLYPKLTDEKLVLKFDRNENQQINVKDGESEFENSLLDEIVTPETFINDYFTYTILNDNEVSIGAVKEIIIIESEIFDYSKTIIPGNISEIIIPEEVIYEEKIYKVSEISEHGFSDLTDLTSVYIPPTIKKIGESAFRFCENLKHLKLPNKLEKLCDFALARSGLLEIDLPNNVVEIGKGVFVDCENLESVSLPENLSNISEEMFSGCTNLKRINIPNSVRNIGERAFEECRSLNEITLPEGISFLSPKIFENCINLNTVKIPNTVKSIGEEVFEGCISLTNINIPNSVESIGEYAFSGCTTLKSVILPDKLTVISGGLFSNCDELEHITLPDCVIKIGGNAFVYCENLKSINIPPDVKWINYDAFRDCKSLTSIIIPQSVEKIEERAFYGCKNLSTVTLPVKFKNLVDSGTIFNKNNTIKFIYK